jgi:hypothetical protein
VAVVNDEVQLTAVQKEDSSEEEIIIETEENQHH